MSDIPRIIVGLASCGISAGGDKVYDEFASLIAAHPAGTRPVLGRTGCIGACYREVLVDVESPGGKYTYCNVTPEKARRIFSEHIAGGKPVAEFLMSGPGVSNESRFFDKQKKIVLRNTGFLDPENLEEYLSRNGYVALRKILSSMSPEQVRKTVIASGLRGRGGAGFSTGTKWELAAKEPGPKKYMVCNADEGDPGAFMDRSVLEGDPHSVLEGLMIAGYAIGADEGFIYVRAEYPLAIKRLELAIGQARTAGYLGKKILGSDFSFDINLKIGAGAFVCGEETALLASIEGRRGMPRLRPPFPAQSGLWGKPTIIHNVETLASVPYVILNGAEHYAAIGTEKSKGTKVFALTGKINRPGLVEVPMGISLREIIFDIGGGIPKGKKFKAVQLGGPSGGCIPEHLIDTAVDYDSLTATGAIMGSGGMVVMDEDTCMVDVAKFFMNFIRDESCGKCTFCRIGTKRMHEILVRITEGKGELSDLTALEELAPQIRIASLCGLGQTAPNPVLTTLRYFREEYLGHIEQKKCRSHVCKSLLTYTVIPDKCTGCTLCAKNCPVKCIDGTVKKTHLIRQAECIRCGNCYSVCRFDAIQVE
jgi:NADH-quinone oxidoreductase subunit F